jgi:hypothetical protein
MVSPDDEQAAVIAKLKADTDLVAALVAAGTGSDEIREAGYQAAEFGYPNIRVRLGLQAPRGNGECRLRQSTLSFTVEAYSVLASSEQVSQLSGLVDKALFGKRLVAPTFETLRLDSRGVLAPFRHAPRTWRGDSYFTADAWDK